MRFFQDGGLQTDPPLPPPLKLSVLRLLKPRFGFQLQSIPGALPPSSIMVPASVAAVNLSPPPPSGTVSPHLLLVDSRQRLRPY